MSDAVNTLAGLINAAKDSIKRSIRTCMPGRVTKWDPSKCRANIQPLIKEITEAEDEGREVNSMPVIPGVAVQFMGAGGMRLTFPIEEGTLGTLFFSHRSLDRWLSGTGAEVDPELDHAHSLTDAIFIPGLMPFGGTWQSVPTDHATLGADGGVQAHFYESRIALGDESGNDWVALAALVNNRLNAIQAAFDAHKHTGVTTGAGTSAVSDTLIGSLASVAASQVKAK